ncbi:MAG: MarC family protein [Verrucomicrobiales bacterium]|nr:MarC family protein [Verrucomicrobiota bacterium JB025]
MATLEFITFASFSLFVIINPFSSIPAFLAITPGESAAERIGAARNASLIAAAILIIFALTGQVLFAALGITIPALQIAGGILLFAIAYEMLRAPDMKVRLNPEEKQIAAEKDDVTVTPLAIPLLCGPGSISTVIILQSQAKTYANNIALIACIPVVYVACFLVLRFAANRADRLNPILIRILKRLMGLIFAVIAVQFVINGVSSLPFILNAIGH